MKKYIGLFGIMALVVFSTSVMAQSISGPLNYRRTAVFSPALFSNQVWNANSNANVATKNVARPVRSQTYTFRYEPGVTTLTEAQKNTLMTTVKRLNDYHVSRVFFVAASRDAQDSIDRVVNLVSFFESSINPDTPFPYARKIVSRESVRNATNNTVKIIVEAK